MKTDELSAAVDAAWHEWQDALEKSFLAKQKYRWNDRRRTSAEQATEDALLKLWAAKKDFEKYLQGEHESRMEEP